METVRRLTYTRQEAAAALGVSLDTFERHIQPLLKVVLCGQLVLIPTSELERWVRENARRLVDNRHVA